ncbi:RNA polymerase sigma factor, partial [Singulisphaera acidiphila]
MADARRTEVHRYLRGLFNVGTVAGLSDGELLDRFTARRGESAELAFAALVERHGPMVLRVCRKVLHDSDDAADAFQATFLVLARKAGSIHRRSSLGAYLHGVALRVANCNRLAVVRRRRHERTYAEKAGTAYQAKPPDDLGRVLHEELGRLPERFRGVAVLCDLEGKTYVEAAGLLGCPP